MAKKTLTRTDIQAPAEKYVLSGNQKFIDTDKSLNRTGKAAQYWSKRGFKAFWKSISNNTGSLPERVFKMDPEQALIKEYNLKGLEFGNWENNETRYNYIFGSIVALHDLNEVLNFGRNIGFGILAVAYGARGSGKASAHFEPGNMIINLTRYARADRLLIELPEDLEKRNQILFLGTGGMGAFAHEYGHFLDVLGGNYFDRGNFYGLTQGRSTKYNFTKQELNQTTMRGLTCLILDSLVNDPKTGQYSTWYEKLKKDYGNNEYWFRQTEIFARTFETYVQYKLSKLKINNKLLTKSKYEASAYPGQAEMKKVIPYFDKLIRMFAAKAKDKQLSLSL